MKDCIFCKIVLGEIPSERVYEDDKFVAFLDIAPINKGHTLVVPKKHSTNVVDASEEVLCDLMAVTKKVSAAVVSAVSAEGFNIGINNGEVSGQAVPHLHVHIIPRFSGDGLKHWKNKSYDEGEAKRVQEAVKKNLN